MLELLDFLFQKGSLNFFLKYDKIFRGEYYVRILIRTNKKYIYIKYVRFSMVKVKVTTTIDQRLAVEAEKKGIKWSVALRAGILKLLNEPYFPEDGEFVEDESFQAQKERIVRTMQEQINILNDEIDELRKNL